MCLRGSGCRRWRRRHWCHCGWRALAIAAIAAPRVLSELPAPLLRAQAVEVWFPVFTLSLRSLWYRYMQHEMMDWVGVRLAVPAAAAVVAVAVAAVSPPLQGSA